MDIRGKKICPTCREIILIKDFYFQGTHYTHCPECREEKKNKRLIIRQQVQAKVKELGL